MLKIIADADTLSTGSTIHIKSASYKVKSFFTTIEGTSIFSGFNVYNFMLFVYKDRFVIRAPYSVSSLSGGKLVFYLDGQFNCDALSIYHVSGEFGRIEIRNENGVLITDNGKPWLDGTYPPDAKNRADLAGLHAAPAVINPELETALMGDETNKERVQE